jgi:predicted nucleic acid-binding protein
MGEAVARPLTLDTGALIALERRVGRFYALMLQAHQQGRVIHIPTTALAQAWRGAGPRMAPLSRLLKQPTVVVAPLGQAEAQAVGRLCAARGTTDIVDAHVALVARATGSLLVTSDPDDLQRLDPALPILAL